MLPYGKQTIEEDDIAAVIGALKGDILTTGPHVAAFEAALAEATGAREAVAVGNGTQALHLACLAAGLGEGDTAIVPSLTFVATANAVRYCGAEVLFCDVNPHTGLIDLDVLEDLLEQRSDANIKAILPVHLTGRMVDLARLKSIASLRNITVIADSCHAIGGRDGEAKVGSCTYEDMATFSFHPVKTVAMGEGGAITLNDTERAETMRRRRSHHIVRTPEKAPWAYEMTELGFNYRVTDFQCALGVSQLKKLERFVAKRRSLFDTYQRHLTALSPHLTPPEPTPNQQTAWHLYSVQIDFKALGISRVELMKRLAAQGVGSQVHYIPVHTQPYYAERYGKQALPGADAYYERTLSLPLFPGMEEEDVTNVVAALKDILH